MTETPEGAPSTGLFGRAAGIVLSPRATYATLAARPRALGALLLFLVIAVAASSSFLSTEVGKEAAIDQQIRAMESFGRQVPDQMYERMQSMMGYAPYFSAAYLLVFFPVATLVVSGMLIAVFNAALGGNAAFKQVYAVVAHSLMILALQQLFVWPVDYAKQSLSSPTNLGVFLPFLDDASFPGRLFGAIDLFLIWWILNLSIGVGVLYKRRTTPIASTMLGIYGAIALVLAAVRTVLSSGA
jgi:Yip1 domain